MASGVLDLQKKFTVAGGDVALELARRGWESARPAFEAAVERPELLRDAAEALVDAGMEILVTPTEEANALAMRGFGRSESDHATAVREMNLAAARIFREAADGAAPRARRVFGAIGPTPQLLLLEETKEDEALAAFGTQAEALKAGGVDGIVFRGFTELASLRLAIRAARELGDWPMVAAMAFDRGQDGSETTLGATISEFCDVAAGQPPGFVAIGIDGGDNLDFALRQLALFRKATPLALWMATSAGHPILVEGGVQFSESPEEFAARGLELAAAGASIVAGGGGVSAEHLAALVRTRDKRRSSRKSS